MVEPPRSPTVESSSYFGPISDGLGNVYGFNEDDDGDTRPTARKSTDSGRMWAAVGTPPSPDDVETFWLARDEAAHLVHIVRQRSSGSVGWSSFRTAEHATNSDTWFSRSPRSPITVRPCTPSTPTR